MANISSLKPFRKGVDPRRNLKGRPHNSKSAHIRFKELLFEALQKKPFKNKDKTFEDLLIEQLIYYALKGKYSFYKLFMDYRFGRPRMAEPFEPEENPPDEEYSVQDLIGDADVSVLEDPEVRAFILQYQAELKNLLVKKGYLKK